MSPGLSLMETLWAGFATIHRRPFLLTIPVLLDLFVWAGPRLTAGPAAQSALAVFRAALTSPDAATLPPDQLEAADEELVRRFGDLGSLNLIGVLGWQLPGQLGVSGDSPALGLTGLSLVGVLGALLFAGIVLAAIYFGLLAQAVRGEPFSLTALAQRVPADGGRMLLWLLLVALTALIVGLPVSIVVGLTAILSSAVATLLIVAIWATILVASWWLAFVPAAVYVAGLGPIRAALASIRIVGQYPWRSLGLLAVVYLLLTGWPIVWAAVASNPVGAVTAIAGEAYLSSGLAAATLIFFRDRFAVRPA